LSKAGVSFASEKQLAALSVAMDAVLASSGPLDLCKQIVHAGFASGLVRGCGLFFLDSKSLLRPVAIYGQFIQVDPGLSAWSDSPIAEAAREKRATAGRIFLDSNTFSLLAIPFIANGVPVGLVALVIDSEDYKIEIPDALGQVISKLGAIYLSSLDLGNVANANALAAVGPEDLTTRQRNILLHIASGLVNLEIAKVLMLSESTIRQETVRIYRALGVGSRKEAVRKAKSLGLIPKGFSGDKHS
jgi:DNA-binding CsgD family transcriptional regulator